VPALGGCGPEATLLHHLEPELTHQAKDPISPTVDGSTSQHLLQPPRTVGPSALGKENRDFFSELTILKPPRALGLGKLSVETAATHTQGPTAFTAAIAKGILL